MGGGGEGEAGVGGGGMVKLGGRSTESSRASDDRAPFWGAEDSAGGEDNSRLVCARPPQPTGRWRADRMSGDSTVLSQPPQRTLGEPVSLAAQSGGDPIAR